jgi:ELWxxDGT repeat protein
MWNIESNANVRELIDFDSQSGKSLLSTNWSVHIAEQNTDGFQFENLKHSASSDINGIRVHWLYNDTIAGLYTFSGGELSRFYVLPQLQSPGLQGMPTILCKSEERIFFVHNFNQLWVTDGTAGGTQWLDTHGPRILSAFIESDSLHFISASFSQSTGSFDHVHHSLHLQTGDKVSHNLSERVDLKSPKLNGKLYVGRVPENLMMLRCYDFHNRIFSDLLFTGDTLPELGYLNLYKHNEVCYAFTRSFHWYDGEFTSIWRLDFDATEIKQIYSSSLPLTGSYHDNTEFIGVGKMLFVRLAKHDTGTELFSIRGDSLELIKDIYPGFGSSLEMYGINWWRVVNDQLYFTATHPHSGKEVWRSDGTAEGTVRVTNLMDGASGPANLQVFDGPENVLLLLTRIQRTYTLNSLNTSNAESLTEIGYPEDHWGRLFGLQDLYGSTVGHYGNPSRLHAHEFGLYAFKPAVDLNNRFKTWNSISTSDQINLNTNDGWQEGRLANIVHALDKEGNIKWINSLEAKKNHTKTAVCPSSGLLYIVYHHDNLSKWGEQDLSHPGLATGLLCVDTTGRVIWNKFLNPGREIYVQDMKLTDERIVIMGYYHGELALSDEIKIGAYYQPQYFYAALDLNGDPLYAHNNEMESFDQFSTNGHLAVSTKHQIALACHSEVSVNLWSSCAFKDWSVSIHGFDPTDGNLQWYKTMSCTDIVKVNDAAVDAVGTIWLIGDFRGTLTMDSNSLIAQGESACPRNGFIAQISRSGQSIRLMRLGENDQQLPIALYPKSETMELLKFTSELDPPSGMLAPYIQRRPVIIEKSTLLLSGAVLGEERMMSTTGAWQTIWDQDVLQKVSADFAYFPGEADRYTLLFEGGIVDTLVTFGAQSSSEPFFIIQRPDQKYEVPSELFPAPDKDDSFTIFPNPSHTGLFQIVLNPDKVWAVEYVEIYDATGRSILQIPYNSGDAFAYVQIPEATANGIYFISLQGENRRETKRLLLLK